MFSQSWIRLQSNKQLNADNTKSRKEKSTIANSNTLLENNVNFLDSILLFLCLRFCFWFVFGWIFLRLRASIYWIKCKSHKNIVRNSSIDIMWNITPKRFCFMFFYVYLPIYFVTKCVFPRRYILNIFYVSFVWCFLLTWFSNLLKYFRNAI